MPTLESRLISRSAYARHRKVSPAMVTKWAKERRIAIVGDRVDAFESDAMLARTLDPARGGKGGKSERPGQQRPAGNGQKAGAEAGVDGAGNESTRSDTQSFQAARARREWAEAARAVQRARAGSGDWVARKSVARAIGAAGQLVNQYFGTFEVRAGAELAAKFNLPSRAVIACLEDIVTELRQTIADAMRQLAKEYRDPGTDIGAEK